MKFMQISAYVHSMSMITADFVSGEIFICDVMLTKLCSLCVQLALGDPDRKRAPDVLWPNEESHRCSSNTGSLKP